MDRLSPYDLVMTQAVYQKIAETIGQREPECGGILGASNEGVVTTYYFDESGESRKNAYIPDVERINRVLIQWHQRGTHMVGIVHSHQASMDVPSCGDIAYGWHILQALDTTSRLFLLIATCVQSNLRLSGYMLCRDGELAGSCVKVNIRIV